MSSQSADDGAGGDQAAAKAEAARKDEDAWKIEIVRCPMSGECLQRADRRLVERLSQRAAAGQLTTRVGDLVANTFESGLVSQSERWFYLERAHAYLLTADDAIDLQQL